MLSWGGKGSAQLASSHIPHCTFVRLPRSFEQKRRGTILHLYRTWAFVQNNDFVETSGVFVVRTRMLRVVRVGEGAVAGGTMPPPAMRANTAPSYGAGGFGGNGGFGSPFSEFVHQSVVITGGPYKGYQGFVKSVTDKGARVELHSNARVVVVDGSKLMRKE